MTMEEIRADMAGKAAGIDPLGKTLAFYLDDEILLIDGTGKYPGYNFYRVAGLAISGKDKGASENEDKPVDVKSLLP